MQANTDIFKRKYLTTSCSKFTLKLQSDIVSQRFKFLHMKCVQSFDVENNLFILSAVLRHFSITLPQIFFLFKVWKVHKFWILTHETFFLSKSDYVWFKVIKSVFVKRCWKQKLEKCFMGKAEGTLISLKNLNKLIAGLFGNFLCLPSLLFWEKIDLKTLNSSSYTD